MEEILYKFIDDGKREQDEMRAFICDFQTTNELKERNNSLIELRFGVQELLKVMNNVQVIDYEVKGVTTRGGKTTTQNIHDNNTDVQPEEPPVIYRNKLKPGLGEPKATRMSLELADRSIQYPRGIIENVLIKVDKFVLPIDFIILDMPEDSRVPIILGRPFLATARTMIDVFNKKITLKVGDDEVIFDVDQSIKRLTTEDDECYRIDDLDDTINEETTELLANEEPDSFLSRGLEVNLLIEITMMVLIQKTRYGISTLSIRRIKLRWKQQNVTKILLNSNRSGRSRKDNLCNTSKNGLQRNMFPGALLHNTIAQVMRERPLTVSFEKKS
ncbi:putative laccase [Tanacetum coccineum]